MSLFNHTPAEISGVDLHLGNRKWENLLIQSVKNKKEENIRATK